MKTFKDTTGREWKISIDVTTIKRIRDLAGVDLLTILQPKANLLDELSDDPIKFVDVLFVAIKPQADAANITDEQFGSAMGGDSIDQALSGFMEELAGFFPASQRAKLKASLAKVEQARQALTDATVRKINTIDVAKLTKAIDDINVDAAISRTLGGSSMTSPAPSALVPGP